LRQSLRSKITKIKTDNAQIVYHLFFHNTHYGLECYKENSNLEAPLNYCLVENITDDEGEAEDFLYRMAKGAVLPIHINDMIEDYF